MDKWRTQVASLPDKEFVVVEIYYEDEQWAEISQEQGPPVVTIYPRYDAQPWAFDVDEMVEILTYAKRRLTGEIP